MIIPPTPDNLKTLAGWALTEIPSASNAQALALHKFKDGCAALIENPLPQPVVQRQRQSGVDRSVVRDAVAPLSSRPRPVPVINIERNEIVKVNSMSCQSGGDHRFDIRTQCCVWCGGTYRQIKGRGPELMR